MSGWCPSSSVCGMAVVCAAAVLPSAVMCLVPYSSHCSVGEYCCHVAYCSLPGVWCVGGGCVSVSFVWWGILCPPLPSSWWMGGPSWMVGGMVSEGRQCCRPPRLCAGVPPAIYPVALLNGGCVGLCVVPMFGLGPPLRVVLPPLVLSSPPSPFVFAVTALLV